jgi:hypothetical protein
MQLHIRHETCTSREIVSYSIQSAEAHAASRARAARAGWHHVCRANGSSRSILYGNVTHVVTMEAPHKEMRIVVEGIADIAPDDAGNAPCRHWPVNCRISRFARRR